MTLAFSAVSMADYSLQYLYTIEPNPPNLDSTDVRALVPVGDFNHDGFKDLAVGLWHHKSSFQDTSLYEAVWIYYGGPSFDTIPDLKIQGPRQYQGGYPFDTGFGTTICGLGDFNGDGYDDIAVAAPGWNWNAGRIYIYFGGPNPDTTADLVIYDHQDHDQFGTYMQSGDFNGDGLGDLLTDTIDHYYGQRVYIYLGGSPPDTVHSAIFDYSGTEIWIDDLQAGFDINNDGFGDFSWKEGNDTHFFLGTNPLPAQPVNIFYNSNVLSPGDISLDGIDDFFAGMAGQDYLFLGGNPVDFYPDYPWPMNIGGDLSIYNITEGRKMLLSNKDYTDHGITYHQFELYNLGVPIDSIPLGIIDYGDDYTYWRKVNIGDINNDGTDEVAFRGGIPNLRADIYNIVYADEIEDDAPLPENAILIRAYPNPFNSSVMLTINNPKGGEVEIRIYDIQGRIVKSFDRGGQGGDEKIVWDATDASGKKVSSGIYFARASNRQYSSVIKLIYLK